MEPKEAITYLRPIADNTTIPNYAAALETAIRSMEELERVKRERDMLLHEKCVYHCECYELRGIGGCDNCRWKLERKGEK